MYSLLVDHKNEVTPHNLDTLDDRNDAVVCFNVCPALTPAPNAVSYKQNTQIESEKLQFDDHCFKNGEYRCSSGIVLSLLHII